MIVVQCYTVFAIIKLKSLYAILFTLYLNLETLIYFANTDVNECDPSLNLNMCSDPDTCVNSDGSYECSCSPGFKLENDMRTCKGKKKYALLYEVKHWRNMNIRNTGYWTIYLKNW